MSCLGMMPTGNSPCPSYHLHKSRKTRLGWAITSNVKAVWDDITHANFYVAHPELILIDLTELILN